jgi:hypothetical protein
MEKVFGLDEGCSKEEAGQGLDYWLERLEILISALTLYSALVDKGAFD